MPENNDAPDPTSRKPNQQSDQQQSQVKADPEPDRLAQAVYDEAPPRLAFPVVGVGGSAGGLEAFIEFVDALPAKTGMAFVFIQHLPPDRESMIADILSKRTTIPVAQVEDGISIEPDHIYVIRPGRTLTIRDGKLHLGEPVEQLGHRHPVDDFFRSLAEEQRERAVAVVMSGMGSNGTAGAYSIKAVGGMCIAQDPETAKFPSMPRNLMDGGTADFVLRPQDIPEVLQRYAQHPYAKSPERIEELLHRERHAFGEVLNVLRSRSRQEFSGYKKPTVLRRIHRRMGLHQVVKLTDYAKLLRQHPSEALSLADDLVIHVTGFFRDASAWESLMHRVIKPLVEERPDGSPVRAWVTACSSGEEAYTLAMLLTEAAEAANKNFDIKIFATDMADRMLTQARNGTYPMGIEGELSPQRLDRFFERDGSCYRIRKELREMIVFAPQNVLQDPPFSRLDICSCRNLLIYLEPEVQRRVLMLVHFGLREGGALFLGSSESIAGVEDLFHPIDKKARIYRRIGPTRHGLVEFPTTIHDPRTPPGETTRAPIIPRASIGLMTQRALLDEFAPPSVVIDRLHEVVYFHGKTAPFVNQPTGEPTREIFTLVREELRGPLRVALHKATTDNAPATVRDGTIETPDGPVRISVTVAPLPKADGYYLVTFDTTPQVLPLKEAAEDGNGDPLSAHEQQLSDDIEQVRHELQRTVEELQTANEELRAANEEVTSVNEELQSSNEELETSKEELQSLNEELLTVNSQLQAKMEELEGARNDLASLLGSTDIAVVFLDTQFRIRRFTEPARDLFELIPADIGRPLSDLARKFEDPQLVDDCRAVLDKLVPVEREIKSASDRWYVRRILPYRTLDNRITGVVMTFIDITRRRAAEKSQQQIEERYRLIVHGVQDYAIIMQDPQGTILTWNTGAQRILGWSEKEAVGHYADMFFTPEDRAARVAEKEMARAAKDGQALDERWHLRKSGERFWGSGIMTALRHDDGTLRGFVKVMRDNTDRKQADDELRAAHRTAEAANQAKDQFLAVVSHELRTPLSAILLWSKMINRGTVEPAQLKEGMASIERSAEAQKQLIEDLLDTSRISSGKIRLDLRHTDIAAVVRAALESTRPAARAKDISIVEELGEGTCVVMGDPDRLQQVFWNLIANAVKFTEDGGSVTVALRCDKRATEISISDTGKGFEPALVPRLFLPFVQAEDPHTRAYSGLGLGLAIAKQLTELHGGTITAHSEGPGKGATFTIRLPLARGAAGAESAGKPTAAASATTAIPATATPLRGKTVLLVEDDDNTREALASILRQAGARLTAAHSAAQALAAFRKQRPDAILSDIAMPDMDGLELLKQIRAAEAKSKSKSPIPAVALSAFTRDEDRSKALAAGFAQHISKPIDPEKLIAVLAELV